MRLSKFIFMGELCLSTRTRERNRMKVLSKESNVESYKEMGSSTNSPGCKNHGISESDRNNSKKVSHLEKAQTQSLRRSKTAPR